MEERYTIKEVLMMTRDMLLSIGTVPLEEVERIGMPVTSAIRNLEECIKVISEDEKRMADQEVEKEETNGNADDE